MERFWVIVISATFGTLFYIWFTRSVKKEKMKATIMNNLWLLHPNSICYWRTGMAILAFILYFYIRLESIAIFIFTFAAILDGADGVVARGCDLGSKWGEWLDPFCDKLTYLPPMVGFAYTGIIDTQLVWILIGIELAGQFLARHVLNWMKISGAANNFGKIKAIICFALVILCALMDANPEMIDIADGILWGCIILAAASIVFKFVPNRLYADILSGLNFCCGVTALILTHNQMFAWAICIIIMGQLFDLFDGRMAMKHGGTKYGPYMDDVADFVSFGLAPAYVVIQKGGGAAAWIIGIIYVAGVAFRLIRFVAVDKKRSDLPEGVFSGFPSPAGALIVLGASLVSHIYVLWIVTAFSVAIMISQVRFAHFGRLMLKEIPKPVFFVLSSSIIVLLAFIFKTKSAQMFGYLILATVLGYMYTGWKWLKR